MVFCKRLSSYALFAVLGLGTAFWVGATSGVAAETTFYVAPNGSDENPGTEAKPFATVAKAQQAVRTARKDNNGDIAVVLRGGVYALDKTLVFESEDSGVDGHNVIYRAAASEKPILSGGKQVVGWKQDEKGRWKAPAPVENFRQLYVGGVRAQRARGDKPAGLELVDQKGYKTTAVAMADWKNQDDVEFSYVTIWANCHCKVQSIQREGDGAFITMQQPGFTMALRKEGTNISNKDQLDAIHIENALELLDEPGEWYLDRKAKTVYYMPRPNEDMTKVEVIAPTLEKIVELRGTLDKPVHNIIFQNIAFEHGDWLWPSELGFVELQANFRLDKDHPLERDGTVTTAHNECLKSPSNVVCHTAKSIRFERCEFTHLGSGGLDLEAGSQDNVVEGCHFHDISGSAIQVGDVLKDDHHPDDARKIVKNNIVQNNYIHACGVEYRGSVGVCGGYTEGTVIAHNEISDLPYSGISLGWGWGEEDAGGGAPNYVQPFRYDKPTTAKNNRIEYNHIHGTMSKTDDGAGIYTLGNQPGTVIRGNHVHDCKNPTSKRGWSQGIYLDEGSGFIEVVGNLAYNLTPLFCNNKAQNRIDTCKFHDNFFDVDPAKAKESEKAKEVVEKAGLESAYRDLLK